MTKLMVKDKNRAFYYKILHLLSDGNKKILLFLKCLCNSTDTELN